MTILARLKSIQAQDLMTKFAVTATADQSIVDLANLFVRFNVSGVPVVDGDHQMVGIVTSSNLFDHMKNVIGQVDAQGEIQCGSGIFVGDIMTQDVLTVTVDASLYDMIKLMYERHIHTFPVVKDGHLVGVIGRRDIVNACYTTVCCSQQKS